MFIPSQGKTVVIMKIPKGLYRYGHSNISQMHGVCTLSPNILRHKMQIPINANVLITFYDNFSFVSIRAVKMAK
jgi:hypothetical protein